MSDKSTAAALKLFSSRMLNHVVW